ncbi:slipin family protein [Anaerovorax odorimutans]|nr:slipin family protein [Anaerovorax odorimutans]
MSIVPCRKEDTVLCAPAGQSICFRRCGSKLNVSAVPCSWQIAKRISTGRFIYMKKIINENQRGLLFKKGRFIRLVEPGCCYLFGGAQVEIVELDEPLEPVTCSLDVLLRNEAVQEQVEVVNVGDEELVLHFVNGRFDQCLDTGRYAFWSLYDRHEFISAGIDRPEVAQEIPAHIFDKIPASYYIKTEVAEYEKGVLFYDQKFVGVLDAGTYYFWRGKTKVNVKLVDTRLTRMEISGQEILSKDKVTLRINFVCNYQVVDWVKAIIKLDNYQEQLHVAAQLILREYAGNYRIDEILENKEELAEKVFQKLKEKEADLYVQIKEAGIKDIILPGEIREIMNTVLIAEKRAQANVITRREEVASTRSLLNTAKLMDENKTLYKLKELEYVEKICENVGEISVAGGDLLGQLREIVGR